MKDLAKKLTKLTKEHEEEHVRIALQYLTDFWAFGEGDDCDDSKAWKKAYDNVKKNANEEIAVRMLMKNIEDEKLDEEYAKIFNEAISKVYQ